MATLKPGDWVRRTIPSGNSKVRQNGIYKIQYNMFGAVSLEGIDGYYDPEYFELVNKDQMFKHIIKELYGV